MPRVKTRQGAGTYTVTLKLGGVHISTFLTDDVDEALELHKAGFEVDITRTH